MRKTIAAVALGTLIGLVLAEPTYNHQQRATFGPAVQGHYGPQDSLVPAWTTLPYPIPYTPTASPPSNPDSQGR